MRREHSASGHWYNALVLILVSLSEAACLCEECCRIIPSVYQAILMVLALSRAATIYRETEGFAGVKLVKVLIVDQVLYFLV